MGQLTFIDLAKKVLEEEKTPMTVEQMWENIQKKGYDNYIKSKGKTPWRSIGARIYVDMRDNPYSVFIKMKTSPQTFYLKNLLTKEEIEKLEVKVLEEINNDDRIFYKERELHPFLSYFIYNSWQVYSKTLFHEKSSKQKYAQWVHPDIVGIYFPLGEWRKEVLELSIMIGTPYIRFYSFEMKRELGFFNIRESFFQTVSNSSWAHYGYLVAANIDEDIDFYYELKRLSMSFGIGVIKIDIKDPDNSEIIFPARYNPELDWDAINKLSENPDFRDFIDNVKSNINSKRVYKEQYDQIYDYDTLIQSINR